MNKIDLHQIHTYHNHNALFLTKEGIVVDKRSHSPVIPFSQLTEHIQLEIESIYLDCDFLIVQCQRGSIESTLPHPIYGVLPEKLVFNDSIESVQIPLLRAIHWSRWDASTKFCCSCGSLLSLLHGFFEKKCTACDKSYYPNLAPAVMILVQRKDEILLARSAHFKKGFYSALAGFVDLGESAESAAHREVKEEVGIAISHLNYFKTQSWPFPNSFMIAFTAQYLDGSLEIDRNEIEDAKWFKLNKLPQMPPHSSISRMLIESVIASGC